MKKEMLRKEGADVFHNEDICVVGLTGEDAIKVFKAKDYWANSPNPEFCQFSWEEFHEWMKERE